MTEKMEIKTFALKVDDLDSEGEGTFTGYLSVFNVVDSYGDVVLPGAFKKTLQEKERFPFCNYHDTEDVLGDFSAEEDAKGLKIKGWLELAVQKAREKHALMKRKIVKGLSMGFRTVKDEWDRDEGLRYLKEVNLWEGSLVTFQACPGALIEAVKADFPIEKLAMMIEALKDRPHLPDKTKQLIYEARDGFSALLGDWEPLEIGTTGPIDTPKGTGKPRDMGDKPDEELIHLLRSNIKELKALISN